MCFTDTYISLRKLMQRRSPEGIGRSVDIILESLRGKKRLDLFECARLDRSYPFEEQMQVLKALKDEGKFDHIGLSEVRASTVREANEVRSFCRSPTVWLADAGADCPCRGRRNRSQSLVIRRGNEERYVVTYSRMKPVTNYTSSH